MDNFKVSVVMPVYNAGKYVEEAVKSAVGLEEVGEIILIEDGSKDNSLEVCKSLEAKYDKVILHTHNGNVNKGASESRNLGISKARHEFISFLDADDLYCTHRFEEDKKVFYSNESIDGVYSAVGYIGEPNGKKFVVEKKVDPRKLFHYLLRGTFGHFHTNGITVKKAVFGDVGYFNPKLVLHQDSEMWFRLAFSKKLLAGNIVVPGALIRRHEGNRIWKGQNNATRLLAYTEFLEWVKIKNISKIDLFLLLKKIARYESKVKNKSFLFLLVKHVSKHLVNS